MLFQDHRFLSDYVSDKNLDKFLIAAREVIILVDYTHIDCDNPSSWLGLNDLDDDPSQPNLLSVERRIYQRALNFKQYQSRSCCQVRSMIVDMDGIYDETLVAPRTLNMGTCQGKCNIGMARMGLINMTDHGYMRAIMAGRTHEVKCVPVEFQRTPFLWKGPGYYEVTMQKMVVSKCGCL